MSNLKLQIKLEVKQQIGIHVYMYTYTSFDKSERHSEKLNRYSTLCTLY